MDMERAAKFQALQESGKFEQELEKVSTPEEMQALFASYGIEMTVDEVKELVSSAVKMNNEELSEEDLENVAGGVAGWVLVAGKWVLKTVAGWAIGKILNKITGW